MNLQPLLPLLDREIGKRPSPSTIWRWHLHGVKVGDRRVKLNVTRIGGQLFSTPEDVAEFIAEQNPPDADDPDATSGRTAATERRLAEAGLL